MEALNEYLWMGGDGIFIWSAYSAAAILLGGLALVVLVGKRSVERRLELLGDKHSQTRKEAGAHDGP